jgi:molybdate transport system substrate-binding protein
VAVLPVAVIALVAACGGPLGSGSGPHRSRDARSTTVVVLAASSIADAVDAAAGDLERERPGLRFDVVGGGSPTLAAQVLEGAPADLLVTADAATLERAAPVLATRPVAVASNTLAVAVPRGNPAGVAALADLARPDLRVGLCAPEVPCGAAARRSLSAAGVRVAADTEEPDVRSLVAKVAAGELDAGVVYATDVRGRDGRPAPGVEGVPIPSRYRERVRYHAAVVGRPGQPAAARRAAADLLDHLRGAGRSALDDRGFGPP